MLVPAEVQHALEAVIPRGVTHVGFVGVNLAGQVLLTEPPGHPYGVSATFSKVRLRPAEQPLQTLDRCLQEQVPYWPTSAFPIPTVWSTEASAGFYFAGLINHMFPTGEIVTRTEVPGVGWCSVADAEQRIGASRKSSSRRRDLGLLHAAAGMVLSPARRVLLMIRELHQRGFERLRAVPWAGWEMGAVWPEWGCDVLPASCVERSNGAARDEEQVARLCGLLRIDTTGCRPSPCSTLGDHVPFGWGDALWDTPPQLAEKFIQRFREVTLAGWGPDPAYAQWFVRMLEATAPHGVFHAVPYDEESTGKVKTVFTPDYQWLDAPPPP
jgi:hypothetical protein